MADRAVVIDGHLLAEGALVLRLGGERDQAGSVAPEDGLPDREKT